MTSSNEVDRVHIAERLRRAEGLVALSDDLGLELIDIARGSAEPAQLLLASFDKGVLRAQARAGILPAILSGLTRIPRRRGEDVKGALARKLAAEPQSKWNAIVQELVAAQVAVVLGYASSRAVDSERAFKEVGVDSLGALELRNRLSVATGLQLPATLVFDYSTPVAVAEYLLDELIVNTDVVAKPGSDAAMREAIATIPLTRLRRAGLIDTLLELAGLGDEALSSEADDEADQIETMDIESLARLTLENAQGTTH